MNKKILLITLGCFLVPVLPVNEIKAQTCSIIPTYITNLPMAIPTGLDSSIAGAAYGCSSRSFYHMMATRVCASGTMQFEIMHASGSTADIDLVIYGPFSYINNNYCTLLTTGNIADCQSVSSEPLTSSSVNVNSGEWYILAFYSIYYSFIDNLGTAQLDTSCINCVVTSGSGPSPYPEICMGTVDSATQKYKLVWNELDQKIDHYSVYKLNLSLQWSWLADIPVGSLSEYIDSTSNPAQHTDRYGLTFTDSCGFTYPQSHLTTAYFTEPLHLSTASNQTGQINLLWNNYTSSINAINYVIFRGNSYSNLVPIDTVPGFVQAYTDLNPLTGINYYKLGATLNGSCVPERSNSMALSNGSMSTPTGLSGTSIPTDAINVFPNPVNDDLNLEINGITLENVQIIDMTGRLIQSYTFKKVASAVLPVHSLQSGFYYLLISSSDHKTVRIPFVKN